MTRETRRLQRFWESVDRSRQYTCRDCGRVDQAAYVQPQPPDASYALCAECISKLNLAYQAERKRQLAAAPRCEVASCRRRGTYRVGRAVLLCGPHKTRAQDGYAREAAQAGPLALPLDYDRLDILRWVQASPGA